MDDPLAYSPAKAASVLGMSRGTVYRLLAQRRLVGRKCNGRTLILRADLEAFLGSLPPYEPGDN